MTKWSLPASTMLARKGVSPLAAGTAGVGRIASADEASVVDNVRAMKMPISGATVRLRRMLVPLGDVLGSVATEHNRARTPQDMARIGHMPMAPHLLGAGPSWVIGQLLVMQPITGDVVFLYVAVPGTWTLKQVFLRPTSPIEVRNL